MNRGVPVFILEVGIFRCLTRPVFIFDFCPMNFRFYGATILLAICSLGLVGFGVWPAQPISKIGSDGFVAPIVNVSSNCECAGHPAGCGCCQPACETRTILVPCWETRYALANQTRFRTCLLYTSPSPRDRTRSRMPSSA